MRKIIRIKPKLLAMVKTMKRRKMYIKFNSIKRSLSNPVDTVWFERQTFLKHSNLSYRLFKQGRDVPSWCGL